MPQTGKPWFCFTIY